MTYTHGHHESVLRSHTWRTAENSAAYLLPHLRAGHVAARHGLRPGHHHGRPGPAGRPRPGGRLRRRPPRWSPRRRPTPATWASANLRFEVGDLFALPYADESSTSCTLHQVLQHLGDPGPPWSRCGGSCAPAGAGGAGLATTAPSSGRPPTRCSTVGSRCTWPSPRATGTMPASVLAARPGPAAGFDDVVVSSTNWTFADPEARQWWGGLWADRVRFSRLAEQAVEYGLSDDRRVGGDRRRPSSDGPPHPTASSSMPHVEILAHR